MSCLIAKAVEQRNKYIVDVYHYGIKCKSCSYDYNYWAMLDFVENLCNTVDVDVPAYSVPSVDTTVDCSGSEATEVTTTACVPPTIIDCNQEFVSVEMQAFESGTYLYSTVVTNGQPLVFEFNSAIVNGTEYLNGTRKFNVDSGTYTLQSVAGVNYITNIITFLNSLGLPGFKFFPGSSQRTMIVRYPKGDTWQIDSVANNSTGFQVHGVKIDQDGLVSLDLTGAGYVVPPYAGSTGDNFKAGKSTLKSGYLC